MAAWVAERPGAHGVGCKGCCRDPDGVERSTGIFRSRRQAPIAVASYVSNLDRHFLSFFASRPMAEITPSLVQDWVTAAAAGGLSPSPLVKYQAMLHSILERAVRDRLVGFAVRMHQLRHAHASWLLAGGSDLKSVMEQMRHAQIQATQKYPHALPEADHKNIDALDHITTQRLCNEGKIAL
ncbi:MAG: tyrosine-type recombinase/integrase [Nocardioidaceae bacterium]|nr:tyrosine-type recombinase/integrase [Nocardioidaceae bacterium]